MPAKPRRLVSKRRRASKNLLLAGKNARQGAELALAANAVIARRTAKAIAGIVGPDHAGHEEFGRLVPEKVDAFTLAGMAWARYAFAAGARYNVVALDECAALGRAAMALADLGNSVSYALASGNRLLAFWGRLEWAGLPASADGLAAQRAITAPITVRSCSFLNIPAAGNAATVGAATPSSRPKQVSIPTKRPTLQS